MTRLDATVHLRTGTTLPVTIDTELDAVETWACQVAPQRGNMAVVFDLADGSGRAVVPSDNISHLIVYRPEPEPAPQPPAWAAGQRQPATSPHADERQDYYDRLAKAIGRPFDADAKCWHNHWGFNHFHRDGSQPHTHSLAATPEQSTMCPEPEPDRRKDIP